MVRWTGLPTAVIVAGRVWLAALTLGLVLLVRRSHGDRGPLFPVLPAIAVLSGVLLAVHWLSLTSAVKQAPVGTVLLITYLAPVVVALVARPVLGEHVPRATFVALGIALAGTALAPRAVGGRRRSTGASRWPRSPRSPTPGSRCARSAWPPPTAVCGWRSCRWSSPASSCSRARRANRGESRARPGSGWSSSVSSRRASWPPIYLACLARLPVATAGVLMYLEPVVGRRVRLVAARRVAVERHARRRRDGRDRGHHRRSRDRTRVIPRNGAGACSWVTICSRTSCSRSAARCSSATCSPSSSRRRRRRRASSSVRPSLAAS